MIVRGLYAKKKADSKCCQLSSIRLFDEIILGFLIHQVIDFHLFIGATPHGCPLLLGDQDGPGLAALERTDNALFLHLVHNTSRTGITKLLTAL